MVVIKLWSATSVSFRILEVQEDEFYVQQGKINWSWPVSRSIYALYTDKVVVKETTIPYS
jgi:hypothetical protein